MAENRLPRNETAEQSLLGAMLLSKEAVSVAVGVIKNRPQVFYKPAHGHIYDAIAAMYAAGERIDPVTVSEHLGRRGLLKAIGGPSTLVALQADAPAPSNAGRHAEIIEELWALRSMVNVAGEIAELGYSLPDDVDAALAEASGMIQALQRSRGGGRMTLLGDALGMTLDDLERRYEGTDTGTFDSGLIRVDSLIGGFQPGSLWMACARSGVGKTAFALCIAAHVALTLGLPVLIHTMEMGLIEIVKRIMSAELMVDGRALRSGKISERDWERIGLGVVKLADAPLWIDDDNQATISSMRANIAEINQLVGGPPALVIVDYVQLMGGGNDQNRQQELTTISRGLKLLAGKPLPGSDAQTVVLALSQLKRDVDDRTDKRPMLKDLRESGAFEQDADGVLAVYREDVYKRNTDKAGMAEISVLKARNGPTGTAEVAFMNRYTKFASLGGDDQMEWIEEP